MNNIERTLVAVMTASVFGLAHSADANESFLPSVDSVNGIVFMSGGIGQNEREAMRVVAADYNLRLSFIAGERGAYLGGAEVRIENSDNRVILDTKALGPWFFARLPKERYRVIATHEAGEITREVDLRQRAADLVLRWQIRIDN